MATCNIQIDGEIALMERYRLTPNELFVLKMLILEIEGSSEQYTFRFLRSCDENKESLRDILVSLQRKSIIAASYKIPNRGEAFAPDEVKLNMNVVKNFYKASYELGEELFEAYPMFAVIQGMTTGLRTVSRKFDSLEDAFRAYGKAIRWNPEVHAEIIELLNWANENNVINYSLASFIIDRRWEMLKALRDGDAGNINFDTIRTL